MASSSSGGKGGPQGLPTSLDLVAIMRAYIDRALSSFSSSSSGSGAAAAANSKGMKTLVLDASTTRSVASAAGQSDLLAAEVYLTEAIENWKRGGEKMAHLKVWRRERREGKNRPSLRKETRGPSIDRCCFLAFSSSLLVQPHHALSRLHSTSQAVYFVRPTRDNVARVRAELRDPRFGAYSLVFCNRLGDAALQDLADADARNGTGRVVSVSEAFGDFEPVDPHHFAISPAAPPPVATLAAGGSLASNSPFSSPLASEPHHLLLLPPGAGDYALGGDALARTVDGLSTVLLSLRRRFRIRASRGSEAVARVAGALHRLAEHDERALFDFGGSDSSSSASYSSPSSPSQQPLLLVLDRRDDPVTPLLTQWSYQAMAHELVGLSGGRLSLAGAPGVSAGAEDVVLSARTDPFFAANARASFGDLGGSVRQLVDAAARAAAASRGAAAAADLQGFVESYGDLSAAQAAAARHVSVVGELSRLVELRALMEVSEVEQELACGGGGVGGVAAAAVAGAGGAGGGGATGGTGLVAAHFDAVARLLPDPRPSPQDKLRLLCLFALRHERDGRPQIDELMRRAAAVAGLSPRALSAVPALLRAGGGGGGGAAAASAAARPRVGDLFGDRSTLSRLASLARASLRGVDNVYTRHTPLLVQTVEAALKGKLSQQDYPFVGGGNDGGNSGGNGFSVSPGAAPTAAQQQQQQHLPRLVVVFVVGGTTFEEAAAVAEINAAAARGEGPAGATGARVLLGGTGVLNSSAFLRTIEALAASEQQQHAGMYQQQQRAGGGGY